MKAPANYKQDQVSIMNSLELVSCHAEWQLFLLSFDSPAPIHRGQERLKYRRQKLNATFASALIARLSQRVSKMQSVATVCLCQFEANSAWYWPNETACWNLASKRKRCPKQTGRTRITIASALTIDCRRKTVILPIFGLPNIAW